MLTMYEHVRFLMSCCVGERMVYRGQVGVVISYPTPANSPQEYYVIYFDPPGEAVVAEPSALEFLGTIAEASEIYPRGDTIRVRAFEDEDGELAGDIAKGDRMKHKPIEDE